MINFGTGPGCLTAPSPGLGRASARGAASADAAVGGMKNPAMQHCFLMSHLSLSLLDSLPCRERDGSCPKSPSEQLLLEQSEEIRPRRAPAARDAGTAAGTGSPRRNAGDYSRRWRRGSGTPRPAQHTQLSITCPDTLVPRADSPGARATVLCRDVRGRRSIPELPGQSQRRREPGAPSLQSPNPDLGGKATSSKALYKWGAAGAGSQRLQRGWLRSKTWHREGTVPASAEAGLAGVSGPKAQAPPAPSAPQRCSSCPREPGHSTRGAEYRRWDPTARAAGAPPTESGDHPGGTPQARQGSRDPSPRQLAQGSWALRRTDEHPSPVMPTDSFPPTDALDICPRCPGPAAAGTLPGATPALGGKGGRAGDPGEPGGMES